MTANDVNVVIDNIASKLGLAARGMADFVPELARYSIVRDIITAVISAVVISVAILAVRWSVKNPPKSSFDWDSPSPFARWFGTIGGIIALIDRTICPAMCPMLNAQGFCESAWRRAGQVRECPHKKMRKAVSN